MKSFLRRLYQFIFFKILGWKIKGTLPSDKKYVLIVAPHTSNWDFPDRCFLQTYSRFQSSVCREEGIVCVPFWLFFSMDGRLPCRALLKNQFCAADR